MVLKDYGLHTTTAKVKRSVKEDVGIKIDEQILISTKGDEAVKTTTTKVAVKDKDGNPTINSSGKPIMNTQQNYRKSWYKDGRLRPTVGTFPIFVDENKQPMTIKVTEDNFNEFMLKMKKAYDDNDLDSHIENLKKRIDARTAAQKDARDKKVKDKAKKNE